MRKQFLSDADGSVITTFSLSSFALLAFLGAAVDYSRLITAKSDLSHAVDAAALAGGKLTTGDQYAAALGMFQVDYRAQATLASFKAYVVKSKPADKFRVEAKVNVPLMFGSFLGFQTLPVSALAEVLSGTDTDIHVALALDTTGSMKGDRLTALKDAASNMVTTLFDKLQRPDQVKFSIVPFARYVNIGLSNRKKPWMSVADDYEVTKNTCTTTKPVLRTYNCRSVSTTKYNDGVPYTSTSNVCDRDYGPPETTCSDKTTKYKWNGCAGSRSYPLNTKDGQYIFPVPGILNVSCPAELTELSSNKAQVLKAVKALSAADETYIPPGLVWAWRTLSPGEPFDAVAAPDKATNRYLILMTDGVNTISPSYPAHNGNNRALADKLTEELCANIKTDGVTIYTIAFEVTDVSVKNMLQTCASGSDRFFDASDSAQLSSSFQAIADQLLALRISR